MLPELQPLFTDCTPAKQAVMDYCASCVAHRLIKIGWEPQINFYDSRRLILLAMHLPVHSRLPIIKEAYTRALNEGNTAVLTLITSNTTSENKATA